MIKDSTALHAMLFPHYLDGDSLAEGVVICSSAGEGLWKYQLHQGKQGDDNEESSIGKRSETEVGVTSIPSTWRGLRRMKSPSLRALYPLPPIEWLVLPGRKPAMTWRPLSWPRASLPLETPTL